MLQVALISGHWSSFAAFEFGARPRSFGFRPQTSEDENQWFLRFIAVAREAAISRRADLSESARELLAGELRQLWRYQALRPALTSAARAVHAHKPWPEGWRAVRAIKYFDYRKPDGPETLDGLELLDELDGRLRPTRLADEVRVYVFDAGYQYFSLHDEFDDDDQPDRHETHRRAADRARDLGLAVCGEPAVLDELSQELFTGEFGFRTEFGQGLGSACDEPRSLWNRLVKYLEFAGKGVRHCQILCGVLKAIHQRNEDLAATLLGEAAARPTLRPFVVHLCLSVSASRGALGALLTALDFDDTPLDQFSFLAWQPILCAPAERQIGDLFRRVLDKPNGPRVILAGLSVRICRLKDDRLSFGPDLKRIGILASTAILREPPCKHDAITERHLAVVLKFCLDAAESPKDTTDALDAFLARIIRTYGTTGGLRKATAVFAEKVPAPFLDGIFLNPACTGSYRRELFSERRQGWHPLDRIGVTELMNWCHQGDFQERLTMLSQVVHPFTDDSEGEVTSFSELAHAIIDLTHNPEVILGNFANSIHPSGWSGSLADIIARRCQPFETLAQDDRPVVSGAAEQLIVRIRRLEDRARKRERLEERERDQRFE